MCYSILRRLTSYLPLTHHTTLHYVFRTPHTSQGTISLDALSAGVSKRVAAACFLEVLQLKTWGRISTRQAEPFADIQIMQRSQ
jgi:chromatin segregation and condensation protein Rec8/ScpA/Scc1 (kleisin family)